jgi:predicted alpha/beta superfamily hydrolase
VKGTEIMRRTILSLLVASALIFVSQVFCAAYAQERTALTDSIYSNVLKEQRSIKVLLPESHKPGSTDRYEVIYVTDGEWAMDPFSFDYKWAQGEGFVPPAIIVAIPNRYVDGVNQRDRDFLPVHVSDPAISGGAANFLAFIMNELTPYIDKKYPANGTNSIYGHSYGGVFVLYALLSEPQLFQSYYATDPPFGWNNDYLLKMAAEKLRSLPPNKVFWIAGRSQNQDIGRLDTLLQLNAPKTLQWKAVTYPNETHNSVRLKAMYDGIKYAYSGYSNGPIEFHPMNGILLKNKPIRIIVNGSYPELRYTVDGTEPDRTSPKAESWIPITGPAQVVLKSFSTTGKYDKTAKANFELGEALHSAARPGNITAGGLRFSYFEGSWEKLPDFNKLKSAKTGVADSAFDLSKLPAKSKFGCVFEGYFEITTDGYYVFALVSKDGSKLFLGDKLILDNDGVHSGTSVKSFVLPLEKGFYPVRVEYFQKDEGGVLQLYYVQPGTENATRFPLKYQYYD